MKAERMIILCNYLGLSNFEHVKRHFWLLCATMELKTTRPKKKNKEKKKKKL